jgi:aerobic carbon-monoxide dehydrogenase medium subunit
MKAAAAGYARANSLAHALELLAEAGGDARLLAGGQSLVPSLNLRLVEGVSLIDINHLDALKGIAEVGDRLRVGALTRHRELVASDLVRRHVPALAEAAPLIAHAAIRTRGTIGGSIAYADPAAELPACAVALGAEIVLAGPAGERRVNAEEFFLGLFETARRDDEIIVAVEFPRIAVGERHVVMELARRSGDYALAGIVLCARLADRAVASARIAFFGVGDAPVLAKNAMAATGDGPDAAVAALARDLDPPSDIHASAGQRRHLAGVLLRRALAAAARGEH